RVPQGSEHDRRVALRPALVALGDVRAIDDVEQEAVAATLARVGVAEQPEDHPVRHGEAGRQLLGARGDEALEDRLVPGHEPALRGLRALELLVLLRVALLLAVDADVLDDVLGRLDDDVAPVVESLPARAPGDLLELADGEQAHLRAVELAELGDENRAVRHVTPDAERPGAAHDLEQAQLRGLLDLESILRQEPRVVHADAVADDARDLLAVPRVRAEARERGV